MMSFTTTLVRDTVSVRLVADTQRGQRPLSSSGQRLIHRHRRV